MHRLLTLISLVTLTAALSAAAAQPPDSDSLLQEGAQLYQEERFEDALEVYTDALSTHGASGPLFYNLGNVYYRTGQIGEAIRYYEKAARRMPDHPKVVHNLNIARQSIDRPIPSIPDRFWERWWSYLSGLLGARGFVLIGLIAYLPAVGLLGYRIWKGDLPRSLRRAAWTLLTAAVVAIAGGLSASWQENNRQRAVVTAAETDLHRDPAADSTVERAIPEGTVVSIDEDLPEWQRVQLPNGAAGWVRASSLGGI